MLPLYLAYIITGLYLSLISVLTVFGLHRLVLVRRYIRTKKLVPQPKNSFRELPHITIQLPIYNEMEVVERLLDSISHLDYPRDRLEVQVLDDSTDKTSLITEQKINDLVSEGLDIVHIRRSVRTGFKAGALASGLESAKGDLVAVFDADFLPRPDFLLQTVGFFADPKISMLQARWDHLNASSSLLTSAQAVLLDGHFQIEHTARNRNGLFFNFNGTAGIWRKSAIRRAGGWEGDTLTEDLDLSYRAQLKGEQFTYLLEPAVPAELPITVDAFKSQQHRWTKGSIQVLRKLGKDLFKADIPLRIRTEALIHLSANFCYPMLLLLGLLILPMLMAQSILEPLPLVFHILCKGVFLCAFFSILLFYTLATRESQRVSWLKSSALAPLGLIVGIGLSLSNAFAVIEALLGRKSEFLRTPKTGSVEIGPDHSVHPKHKVWRPWLALVELHLALYFAYSCMQAFLLERYEALPFLMLFLIAFSYFAFLGATQQFRFSIWSKA